MARGDEWMLEQLRVFLPDGYLQFLTRHVLSPRSPLQLIRAQLSEAAAHLRSMVYPVIKPVLDRILLALWGSPDVVVLGFILVGLYFVLQLVFMVKRMLVWWTGLAMRLLWYAFLVALVSAVYQRGFETALRDLFVLSGKIMGYAVVVKNIWMQEYDRYNAPGQVPPPGSAQTPPRWRADHGRGRTGWR